MSARAIALVLLAAGGGCAGLPRAPSPERAMTMFAEQGPPHRADVLLVHGCPALDDGSPSTCNVRRTRAAVDGWRRGLAPRVFFTGGAVVNRWPEAVVMAGYARSLGVHDDAIVVETESRHTVTNLSVAKGVMKRHGWKSAIQVSEAMHLVWAKQLARFYGMHTQLLPSDMVPPYTATWVRAQRFDDKEPWRAQTAAYGVPQTPPDGVAGRRRIACIAIVYDDAAAADVERAFGSVPGVELQVLRFDGWASMRNKAVIARHAAEVWLGGWNGPVDDVLLVGVGPGAGVVRAASPTLPRGVRVAAVESGARG